MWCFWADCIGSMWRVASSDAGWQLFVIIDGPAGCAFILTVQKSGNGTATKPSGSCYLQHECTCMTMWLPPLQQSTVGDVLRQLCVAQLYAMHHAAGWRTAGLYVQQGGCRTARPQGFRPSWARDVACNSPCYNGCVALRSVVCASDPAELLAASYHCLSRCLW